MFGRYAIAFGRGAHRHALRQRGASLGLPNIVEGPELLLLAAPGTAHLCASDAILVGQIFNSGNQRLGAIPSGIADAANSAELRDALIGTWGNYALFFAKGGKAGIYREPSGSIPVYRLGDCGQAIFVSDTEFAQQLDLLDPAKIDPKFLVHWLQFPFLKTRRTGLASVTELLPGMLLQRGAGEWIETPAWHPSEFTRGDRAILDELEAARCLREAALGVVGAQPAGQMVLRLSGGLDSSILAACLAKAGHNFSCINFATRARDGDERDYAREVAREFGLDLVEVGEPKRIGLEAPRQRSFRPLINPLLEPFERSVARAAEELGTTLLIDGAGGDNLFCSITSAAPVVDALASGSVSRSLRAASDIATRANCTLWDVLVAATRKLLRRRPIWKEDRSFLRPESLLRACEAHPWLEGLVVPPGKREHVEALVHIQHFLDRPPSSIGLLHPLLAQPLLELCLAIPSWLWVRGGRDRAVARDAFIGLVPSSVLQRRMKGSLQSLLYSSFLELRFQMHELLQAGELGRRGIIDTDAIERALTGEEYMRDEVQLRISEMVALELWLGSWRLETAGCSTGS